MKSKELRIGNWLNGPEGNAQVTGIQDREVVEIGEIGHVMEDVSPIPLTKEWLIKFGFNKHRYNFKSQTFGSNEWIELDEAGSHYDIIYKQKNEDLQPPYDCILMSVEIKYVHQLQNMYHALTGEELTIKEQK